MVICDIKRRWRDGVFEEKAKEEERKQERKTG